MARHVLALMLQNQIHRKVIFVARFVNHNKIYSDRVSLYLQAAVKAVNTQLSEPRQIKLNDDGTVNLQKPKKVKKKYTQGQTTNQKPAYSTFAAEQRLPSRRGHHHPSNPLSRQTPKFAFSTPHTLQESEHSDQQLD